MKFKTYKSEIDKVIYTGLFIALLTLAYNLIFISNTLSQNLFISFIEAFFFFELSVLLASSLKTVTNIKTYPFNNTSVVINFSVFSGALYFIVGMFILKDAYTASGLSILKTFFTFVSIFIFYNLWRRR